MIVGIICGVLLGTTLAVIIASKARTPKPQLTVPPPNPFINGIDPKQNLAQLQQAKQGIVNLRQHGATDPDIDLFEKEIDAAIAELDERENRELERLKRQQLEQQDDICPECGQTFACNDDYICDSCRSRVG